MNWLSPPDRREIFLVVFSISVYFLAYYWEVSSRLLGIDPATSQAVLSRFGSIRSSSIGRDGRKLPTWRDTLEDRIFGKWAWLENHIAEDDTVEPGTGKYGIMWTSDNKRPMGGSMKFWEDSVGEGRYRWDNDIPQTRLLRHVAGYTILDNIILHNNTVYIVTDNVNFFPPISSVVSVANTFHTRWEFLSSTQARAILGSYGSFIKGVTWLVSDSIPYNTTLLSLWRTYSALDPSIDTMGRTILPPPRRLIYRNSRFFTDENPDFEEHWIKRRRADTGFHPFLAKAIFPDMTVMYYEDWEDWQYMQVPFVFDRMVVSDQVAALEAVYDGQPSYAAAFQHQTTATWWEPMRRALAEHFDVSDRPPSMKTITYIQRQTQLNGPRLADEDHQRFVSALQKLGSRYKYQINIISSLDHETGWDTRMGAIARSTIVIGLEHEDLLEAVYMQSSSRSTVIEIFAPNSFLRDRQLVISAVGLRYIAWQYDRKFNPENLPHISIPAHPEEQIRLDVDALIETVQKIV